MQFISDLSERTGLELKYCECCGGLWLRTHGTDEVRCGACVVLWSDLAGGWARRLERDAAERQKSAMRAVTANLALLEQGGRA